MGSSQESRAEYTGAGRKPVFGIRLRFDIQSRYLISECGRYPDFRYPNSGIRNQISETRYPYSVIKNQKIYRIGRTFSGWLAGLVWLAWLIFEFLAKEVKSAENADIFELTIST